MTRQPRRQFKAYVEPITVTMTVQRRAPLPGERGWWFDKGAPLADVGNNALAEADDLPGWPYLGTVPSEYRMTDDGNDIYAITLSLTGEGK